MYNNSNLAFNDDYAKFNNQKTKKQRRKEKRKADQKPNSGNMKKEIIYFFKV